MRLRTARIMLVAGLGSLALLQTGLSQNSSPGSSPLQVTAHFSSSLGPTCNMGVGIIAEFHYAGSQPLRGYLVRLGNLTTRSVPLTIEDVRDSEHAISPGDKWTRAACFLPKAVLVDGADVTPVKVDVLKFDDGSASGPISLRLSHYLVGAIDGMDFIGRTTDLKKFVSPILPEGGPTPREHLQTQTIGPLKIESGIWRDLDGEDMLAMDITNEGSMPIRGYRLTITFLDPATGARLRGASTKQLETQGNASEYLAPGESWIADPRRFSHLADGSLANYTISVDLIAFADGSTFGPTRSEESEEVLGMLYGIDTANLLNRGSIDPLTLGQQLDLQYASSSKAIKPGIEGGLVGRPVGPSVFLPPLPALPVPGNRIRIDANVQMAKLISKVIPIIPATAGSASGTIVLHAVVGKNGNVQELQYMSGPPPLMRAAMDAAKQWTYQPTLLNGEAVEVDTTIEIAFPPADQ